MARLLALLTVFVVMIIGRSEMSPSPETSCDYVYENFLTCIRYLVGIESNPSKECCESMAQLNSIAKQDSKTVCQCVENLAHDLAVRFLNPQVDSLPLMCNTYLSFPISNSMDCSK